MAPQKAIKSHLLTYSVMSAKYKVPRVDIYSTLGLHMTTPIARRRTVADKMDQMIISVTNSPQKNHGDKMDQMILPVIARRTSAEEPW
jgi:methyl coenzyme M reductase subunit C